MEEKNNDRITKMKEEIDNKFWMSLREIRDIKSESTSSNLRSETTETQDTQQSGSKANKSIGIHASNNKNSDSEND